MGQPPKDLVNVEPTVSFLEKVLGKNGLQQQAKEHLAMISVLLEGKSGDPIYQDAFAQYSSLYDGRSAGELYVHAQLLSRVFGVSLPECSFDLKKPEPFNMIDFSSHSKTAAQKPYPPKPVTSYIDSTSAALDSEGIPLPDDWDVPLEDPNLSPEELQRERESSVVEYQPFKEYYDVPEEDPDMPPPEEPPDWGFSFDSFRRDSSPRDDDIPF